MSIWKRKPEIAEINKVSSDTLAGHLGIEFFEVGDDYLKARMPVDNRTVQPLGMLHGGASVTLAESLGSVGSYFTLDTEKYFSVGLEINANHVKSVEDGWVTGTARPVHIGGRTQIWEIKITNSDDQLVCISRLTLAVISNKAV